MPRDERPIRVLYSFPHQLGRSGIGTTAWHQVAGLIEAGQEVTVVCGTCERPVSGATLVIETMRIGGLRIPYRAIGRERAWKLHDWKVSKVMSRMRDHFDVVHTWPSGALATLRTARKLGIKSFLERPNTHTGYAYDIVRRECEKLGVEQKKMACHTPNPARLAHEEAEFAAADRLLCPSEFVARTFTDRGFPLRQISRHRYGCDTEQFKPLQGRDAEAHVSEAPLSVAFVGTCEPRKGLHLALAAWLDSTASRDGVFTICGKFITPGYRQSLGAMLQHPSVKEIGFTPDVGQFMARSHALVLPTLEEGSALVTYEARAAGCVPLVSEAAGAMVEDGVNALVHHVGDVETLSRQMTMLSEDRTTLKRLREQGLADAESLSWSAAGRDLVACYRECLGIAAAVAPQHEEPAPSLAMAGSGS